ncbi:MAG: response regulator [Desulfobacteraceae bacterium]|jgi:CheY-like chemotaxis protein
MKLKRSRNKERLSDEIKKGVTADSRNQNLTDSLPAQTPKVDLDIKTWRVLLVDDEPDVHEITRIALKRFTFDGKNLELTSAYSAEQAREILQNDHNFSVAMIDVVMETQEAGLDLVRFIREEKGLSHIRLIVRTGQPGKAPEKYVIDNFDIDDYKEKTDLTSIKLYTLFRSSIKSYRDILAIERSRVKLDKKVKERTKELQKANKKLEATIFDLQKALQNVKQLSGLLPICSYCKNIRDNTGYWNQVEEYIKNHSDVDFSHSICPKCAEKYHPDVNPYDD